MTLSILMAALMASCGGGNGSAETTSEAIPTTAAPTTTTTAAPTTTTAEPSTTTTTEAAGPTVEELAGMIVLPSGFFGAGWDEVPQTESDFSYASIDGCEFVDDLDDADGHLTEAESPEFSQFDTQIEHDVRVYPDAGAAIDVVLAWAQEATLECTLEAARIRAQESLDRGELAPYTSVDIEITRFDNVVGEPRVTNFEIVNTLGSPDGELVIFVDIYFVQTGRSVSAVQVTNPDTIWDSTDQLLDAVLERMLTADEADAS